jgi:nucleotide-binding universal stress UspA family protein
MEINVVLCPIDFSEFSIRAYHYAQSMAVHYRAKLVVQHVVELSGHPSLGFAATAGLYQEFCKALYETGKHELRAFVKKHTHAETHLELVVQQGTAADSILSFAEAQKMHVIVMGTHGRRGFDRLVLGSVTDRVIRRASCPVLAICKPLRDYAAEDEERHHVHHLSRILFCTDFSENSERALNYAISATAEYDAELTLLHVLEEAPTPANTQKTIANATGQLDRLIAPEKRKTMKIKTVVRIGKAYEQIIQFAVEERVDMVTMGVKGRDALDAAIFGSTTYRVIQLGPCPVLAVRIGLSGIGHFNGDVKTDDQNHYH